MVLMSKLNKTPHFCKYNYSSMRIPKKWEKKCLGMFNWKFESIYLPLSNNSKDDGYDRYVDDEWCSKIIYYNQVSISSRHKSYFHYVNNLFFVFFLHHKPFIMMVAQKVRCVTHICIYINIQIINYCIIP